MAELPSNFLKIQERYPEVISGLQQVHTATHAAGPLDDKTAHLIQLAASAAQRSEGAVHSHTRRALEKGVSAEELRHALVLIIPTIGFPAVAAALSWVDDILGE